MNHIITNIDDALEYVGNLIDDNVIHLMKTGQLCLEWKSGLILDSVLYANINEYTIDNEMEFLLEVVRVDYTHQYGNKTLFSKMFTRDDTRSHRVRIREWTIECLSVLYYNSHLAQSLGYDEPEIGLYQRVWDDRYTKIQWRGWEMRSLEEIIVQEERKKMSLESLSSMNKILRQLVIGESL